jgi:hypothetical protein
MIRTRARFILFFFLCFLMSINSPGGISSTQHVQAQEPANYELNLPIVMRPFPTTPTIFGMHLEIISIQGGLNFFANRYTSWTRKDFPWDVVEPVEGQRNWDLYASLDTEIQQAYKDYIRVIGIIGSTPTWAGIEGRCVDGWGGVIAEEKLAAFGRYVYDLVKRYHAAPYYMTYWELWNEPDVVGWLGCWGEEGDPYYGGRYYAEMLKVAYPNIKAADPNAQVLFGGLLLDCNPYDPPPGKTCIPGGFLEGALINGAGPYFDGVSFHAYDFYRLEYGVYNNGNFFSAWNTTGPILTAKTNYIRFFLDKYGYPGKSLINTEDALLCDVCSTDSVYYQDFERTKINYIANAYSYALAAGLKANIWYSAKGWRNSQLINSNLTSRPAYDAYLFASKKLAWVEYKAPVTPDLLGGALGLMGHQFKTLDGKKLWTLWSLDGLDHVVTLPESPTHIWDALGVELTVTTPFTVTLTPLYITW